MKRTLSLLLCLVLVFVAAGCGGGGETEAPQEEALMAPGTYTGYGQGFYAAEKVEVKVTVDENSIVDIEVSRDNGGDPAHPAVGHRQDGPKDAGTPVGLC